MTKQVEFRGLLPYLYYEDAGAMLDWLSRVFGFEERGRYIDKDGIVRQAEMLVGENELWFSGHGPGFWEAQRRTARHLDRRVGRRRRRDVRAASRRRASSRIRRRTRTTTCAATA